MPISLARSRERERKLPSLLPVPLRRPTPPPTLLLGTPHILVGLAGLPACLVTGSLSHAQHRYLIPSFRVCFFSLYFITVVSVSQHHICPVFRFLCPSYPTTASVRSSRSEKALSVVVMAGRQVSVVGPGVG